MSTSSNVDWMTIIDGKTGVITIGDLQIVFDNISFSAANDVDVQHDFDFPKPFKEGSIHSDIVIVGSVKNWIGGSTSGINIWGVSATKGKVKGHHRAGRTIDMEIGYVAIGPAP